jgi:hypothetical protein
LYVSVKVFLMMRLSTSMRESVDFLEKRTQWIAFSVFSTSKVQQRLRLPSIFGGWLSPLPFQSVSRPWLNFVNLQLSDLRNLSCSKNNHRYHFHNKFYQILHLLSVKCPSTLDNCRRRHFIFDSARFKWSSIYDDCFFLWNDRQISMEWRRNRLLGQGWNFLFSQLRSTKIIWSLRQEK